MANTEQDFDDTYLSEDDIYDSDISGEDEGEEIEDDVDLDIKNEDDDEDHDDGEILEIAPLAINNLLSSLSFLGLTPPLPINNTSTPTNTSITFTPKNTPIQNETIQQRVFNPFVQTAVNPFVQTPVNPFVQTVVNPFVQTVVNPFVQSSTGPQSPSKSTKKDSVKFVSFTAIGLNDLTAEDIKEYCRIKGIKGYSNKNKGDLIEFVLNYPLHEPFSYKSTKSDITVTMNPPGVNSPQPSTPGIQVTNSITLPSNEIVAPTQFTPTYVFSNNQQSQPTTSLKPVVPLTRHITQTVYTSAVSPPVIPEIKNLLEVSPITTINEYRTAVADSIKTDKSNNQEIATEANKSANEQFLGVKYETPSIIKEEIKM